MKIELRKLEKGDAPLFYKWWNDDELRVLTSDTFERMEEAEIDEIIEKHLNNPLYYDFILLAEGKSVGHILIQKKKEAEFFELYVAIGEKDYWDKGVGTEAIGQVLGWFWSNFPEEKTLQLEVNKDNLRAKKCYEKCGFGTVGEKSYQNHSDTYILQVGN